MLSVTVEYAIRALVCLAGSPEQRLTARVIARRTGIPAGYLPKVLLTLANARLLDSRKGSGGGFSLARPASTVTLLDIAAALKGASPDESCPALQAAGRDELCPLRRRLAEAREVLMANLASTTLAELVRDDTGRLVCCCDGDCTRGCLRGTAA